MAGCAKAVVARELLSAATLLRQTVDALRDTLQQHAAGSAGGELPLRTLLAPAGPPLRAARVYPSRLRERLEFVALQGARGGPGRSLRLRRAPGARAAGARVDWPRHTGAQR